MPNPDSTCTADVAVAPGEADCFFDTTTDPESPYVMAHFTCPTGTTALQNGCAGTGSLLWVVSTIQDGNAAVLLPDPKGRAQPVSHYGQGLVHGLDGLRRQPGRRAQVQRAIGQPVLDGQGLIGDIF